jgi:hypothetical protein
MAARVKNLKKSIFRAFKLQGLAIRTDAIRAVESVLRKEDDADAALEAVIRAVKSRMDREESISAHISRLLPDVFFSEVVCG